MLYQVSIRIDGKWSKTPPLSGSKNDNLIAFRTTILQTKPEMAILYEDGIEIDRIDNRGFFRKIIECFA